MSEKGSLETLDTEQIMNLLPHRYPFLLVDRVIEIDGDDSAIGIKNVTFNEPHFTGHFPGKPVMPGVLIVEAMAQTALVFFMTIDNAKFRKPVVPGDRLEIHVKKQKQRGGIFRYAGEAIVDGVKVAEADVQAMVTLANAG
jgi:3-hydroxyacyl-[acyl-carrier-protein] dehydratase